ncbi:gelsolin [Lasiosphaeris hirsuta]|uniref:Gelsolin n=1 Tax=Lasiosphaeris hirsuta TaxID=260670 RepID=A0AA40E7B5_9PEZI|nr:gelsolin [Lasiosphaeris hirsuta]
MAPHDGLVHLKEYDIKDSNVELIGTDLDHKVKYNSAATEPAWNDGRVGIQPGLLIWHIEDFAVVPVPREKYGYFFEGDSYILLHSQKATSRDPENGEPGTAKKLIHDLFFWLGMHTSQDEAGVAAYKTVELDEFLGGAATQHREIQASPSDDFLALFPRLTIRRGGVASGFHHVESDAAPKAEITTLLRIFKHHAAPRGRDSVLVYEVDPTWRSLDENDVFILDKGDKIWVWQGRACSPMEKAKAAQVVHDMTLAKHVDVEVVAQTESRSRAVARELGGDVDSGGEEGEFHAARPIRASAARADEGEGVRKLFRLSDASGELAFDLVGEGESVSDENLDGNDVFLLDDAGRVIWVWEGRGASRAEKAIWLKVAQAYVKRLQSEDGNSEAYLTPIARVREGSESAAFLKAIRV